VRAAGPGQPVRELSGGNQQKVALARLLHHDVDVLLLDEPTRGIDVASKAQIYALVDGLVAPPRRRADARPRPCSWPAATWPSCSACATASRSCAAGGWAPPRPAAEWNEHALMMAATGTGDAA
jgi:ribose transport system ATP-binding protein